MKVRLTKNIARTYGSNQRQNDGLLKGRVVEVVRKIRKTVCVISDSGKEVCIIADDYEVVDE